NLEAALALLVVEPIEADRALDARRLAVPAIAEGDADLGERPAFAVGVHAQGDGGAGAEAREQGAEGRGAGIDAAPALGLVGDQRMPAGADGTGIVRDLHLRLGTGDDGSLMAITSASWRSAAPRRRAPGCACPCRRGRRYRYTRARRRPHC